MNYSRRQLYALGEPLGDAATFKTGGKIIYGSGGDGAPTQQTITQSNIPDWLRPQVETVLGGAMQEMFRTSPGEDGAINVTGVKPFVPYSANPADYVAGFSPMQQQAMYGASNLQMPGQFGAASQMSGMAGMGGLGAAQQAGGYGNIGVGYGAQAAQLADAARGFGQSGARYGDVGAGYGAQAAQLASEAQGLGQRGAGYGDIGVGYGAQAAQLADAAQRYGAQGAMGAAGVGTGVGNLARGYAAQQAGAGGQYAGMATDPSSMQAYMSPYMQNVVDVQQQAAQRQADIANQATQARFAQSGAFGGARQGIQQAQAAADLARQKQGIQAQGLQSAFQNAQQAQQFGSTLGLQGLAGAQQGLGNVLQGGALGLQGSGMGLQGIGQAGQMYGLGMQGAGLGLRGLETGLQGIGQAGQMYGLGMQGAGLGMRGAETGLQGIGQAGQMYGLGMQGAGMGLKGVETGLGGYGLLGQQAGVMGDLGTRELAARQGIIGTQLQMGGMEQQQQQNIINQAIQNYAQAQQYPLQQYNAYNALLRGYAVPGQTATTYQAAPSLASQAAGLGMGAYGLSQLMKKKGGAIKAMAEGGISDIDDKVRNNPTKYSEEQIKRSVANEVLDPQTAAIALGEIARARKAAAGINMLQSGLPAQGFAPGGIIAFDDGGRVERYQDRGLVRTQEEKDREALLRSLRLFGLAGKDVLTAPVRGVAGAFESVVTRPLRAAGVSIPYLPESFYGGDRGSLTPYMDALRREERVKAEAERDMQERQSVAIPVSGASAAPAASPQTSPAPLPLASGVAALQQPSRMTVKDILKMAKDAGRAAVPAGLSGAGLSALTPETYREAIQQAMPPKPLESELTPLQERLAVQTREAAAASLEESKGISERMDKLRASQEARYTAKARDLETDRNRSVGIAFLEAAQAMTQPGQSFFQGLTRSAAAGGKRLMEDKERLDAKADKLTEALERLDESRLGDARERNAAQANYRNALLGVEREMVNNAATNLGINKAEARDIVKMGVEREVQAATLDINRRRLELDAQRNAIAAAGVAQQGVNKELEILQTAVADPRIAAVMQRNPQKNIMEYYADWMKGAGPQVQMMPSEQRIAAFLADMAVLGGPRSAPVSSTPTGTVVNQPPAR